MNNRQSPLIQYDLDIIRSFLISEEYYPIVYSFTDKNGQLSFAAYASEGSDTMAQYDYDDIVCLKKDGDITTEGQAFLDSIPKENKQP